MQIHDTEPEQLIEGWRGALTGLVADQLGMQPCVRGFAVRRGCTELMLEVDELVAGRLLNCMSDSSAGQTPTPPGSAAAAAAAAAH
eukprot:79092-Chlamydomonas_euryale.AAC.1